MRLQFRAVVCALAVLCVGGCRAPLQAPLPTVAQVDLSRYMGTWFEIAHLPNRFQADCVADTQARYRLKGDEVEVLNRCREANGAIKQARGVAEVVEGSGNAKLRVSFFRPFYGDYWVLALAEDYRWVLVGEPSREYAWVLSRSPVLEEATLEAALSKAGALGFDRGGFVRTPQRTPLD
jgi:apolipoprotein D and lipocalin family protein